MDIKLLTLLLFLCVASSFAELRSPFFRTRRSGTQESATDLTGISRIKRASDSSEATEKPGAIKSTTEPITTASRNTKKKPDSRAKATPTSSPTTSSTDEPTTKSDPTTDSTMPEEEFSFPTIPTTKPKKPKSGSTTPKPGSSSTSSTTPDSDSTTPESESTTPESDSTTPESDDTTPDSDDTTPDSDDTTPESDDTTPESDDTTPESDSTTPKPNSPTTSATKPKGTPTSSPKSPAAKPKPRPTPSSPSNKPKAKPTTSSPTTKPKPAPTTSSSPNKPGGSSKPTTTPKKPTTPGKPSDSDLPGLGSRFDPEDEPEESHQKPMPESNAEPNSNPMNPMNPMNPGSNPMNPGSNPMNPGFPDFGFPPFFIPNPFVPYNPYNPYNPYGDPSANTIPNAGNYAWTGTNNGGAGVASSFASASASASAGAPHGANYNNPIGDYQGGYGGNEPAAANTAPLPNVVNTGVYSGSGGDTPTFDPSSFAFPGNFDNFQKQMEDNFKRFQSQLQQQQQAIFDATNRIGSEGFQGASSPGAHTAFSSINLGPEGGYQAGAINPVAPGVQSRFAEDLPAPSGGTFGVFSSSSSNTMTGPDGKTVSRKVATTGVNDNGKVTFRTVQD